MATHPFLSPAAKQAVQHAVIEMASRTAAEIIVSVRRTSGRYREADYLAGFLAILLVLVGLLYLATAFPLWTLVPNVALGFVGGALAVSSPRGADGSSRRGESSWRTRGAWPAAFVAGGYSGLAGRQAREFLRVRASPLSLLSSDLRLLAFSATCYGPHAAVTRLDDQTTPSRSRPATRRVR